MVDSYVRHLYIILHNRRFDQKIIHFTLIFKNLLKFAKWVLEMTKELGIVKQQFLFQKKNKKKLWDKNLSNRLACRIFTNRTAAHSKYHHFYVTSWNFSVYLLKNNPSLSDLPRKGEHRKKLVISSVKAVLGYSTRHLLFWHGVHSFTSGSVSRRDRLSWHGLSWSSGH